MQWGVKYPGLGKFCFLRQKSPFISETVREMDPKLLWISHNVVYRSVSNPFRSVLYVILRSREGLSLAAPRGSTYTNPHCYNSGNLENYFNIFYLVCGRQQTLRPVQLRCRRVNTTMVPMTLKREKWHAMSQFSGRSPYAIPFDPERPNLAR